MRHRLENAIDFFPLPVAQAALCPPSVSHFPFYGSPPSFLVEASLLSAVGSSWRGTVGIQGWYGIRRTWLLQLHLFLWACVVIGSVFVHQSSSSLEMMSDQKKRRILFSVHWFPLILIITSFFVGPEDIVHVHTSQRVWSQSTFVCDSCSCRARP